MFINPFQMFHIVAPISGLPFLFVPVLIHVIHSVRISNNIYTSYPLVPDNLNPVHSAQTYAQGYHGL